jgi:F-type H+-transporting ATPase subunit alpha
MPETPESWLERARQSVAATVLAPELRQIGRIDSIGDGVAMISGLPNARLDELLHFDGGRRASSRQSTAKLLAACCSTMPTA